MIIVLGQFELAAGYRDEFMRSVRSLARASRSEPGCLEYAFLIDPIDPRRVVLVGQWATADMFDAHLAVARRTATSLPRDGVHPASGWTIRYRVDGSSQPRPFNA